VASTTQPHLVLRLKKEYIYTSSPSLLVIVGYGVFFLHNIVHLPAPSSLNSHIFLNSMFLNVFSARCLSKKE